MVKYIAIAASAALPPDNKMLLPVKAACGSSATTVPRKPRTWPTGAGAGLFDAQPAMMAALNAQSVI